MKFRAQIGSALQLSKLVGSMAKLGDSCLAHFSSNMIQFAVSAESGGVRAHADVHPQTLFLSYRIESKAAENRISFFVKLDNLARALKTASGLQVDTSLKLTKKNGVPMLTFEIKGQGQGPDVQHDVPLRIVTDVDELAAYREPSLPDDVAAISVVFPATELRALRNVVERMRAISDYLQLTASGSDASGGGAGGGTLKLEAEKDNLVSIATTYARLDVQLLRGAEAATADAEAQRGVHEAVARVEAKKLQKVLAALLGTDIKVHNALLCIIPHTSVVLKFFLPDQNTGSSCLIFYLPACLL